MDMFRDNKCKCISDLGALFCTVPALKRSSISPNSSHIIYHFSNRGSTVVPLCCHKRGEEKLVSLDAHRRIPPQKAEQRKSRTTSEMKVDFLSFTVILQAIGFSSHWLVLAERRQRRHRIVRATTSYLWTHWHLRALVACHWSFKSWKVPELRMWMRTRNYHEVVKYL
jgi:hypothetical protein